jgi:hypothetical protein
VRYGETNQAVEATTKDSIGQLSVNVLRIVAILKEREDLARKMRGVKTAVG